MRFRLSVSATLVGHRLTLDFFFFFQAAVRSCELHVLRLVDRSFGKSFPARSSECLNAECAKTQDHNADASRGTSSGLPAFPVGFLLG
jgi:hypothetical protein